jgi:hypothetical protein
MYIYLVYWPDGFVLRFLADKWLSLAEVQFLAHCSITDKGDSHDPLGFVRTDIALPWPGGLRGEDVPL